MKQRIPRGLMMKLGIESGVFGADVKPPAPLPELRDKYGGRVHLFARTLWVDEDFVPDDDRVRLGSSYVRPRVGVHRMRDGEIIRFVMAFQKISDIAKVTCIFARKIPWTPEVTKHVLARKIAGIAAVDAMLDPDKTVRVDMRVDGEFEGAYDSANYISDTYTVMGHCLTPSAIGARLKMLDYVKEEYGGLINTAVVLDRGKDFRPYSPESKNNFFVTIPYTGDDCSDVLVDGIGPNVHRDDEPAFRAWVSAMAAMRCSDKWVYRRDVHEIVDYFQDRLAGMDVEDELKATITQLTARDVELKEAAEERRQLQNQLTAVIQDAEGLYVKLAAADERAREAESAKTAAEEKALQLMVCAQQLFDENRELKERLQSSVQRRQQLKKAASVVGVDVKAVEEENESLRRALHASENRARAVAFMAAPEERDEPLRAPESWDELYERTAQLQNIRMTFSAVEPALGTLDHHQQSANWLERAWITLDALDEFAASDRSKYPNFRLFCQEHPRGKLTVVHVVLNEGETVRGNRRMQAERTFFTERGPLEMLAHVRIGSGAPPAPRLYFHDASEEGVVYVGYIGPHLTNTKTN